MKNYLHTLFSHPLYIEPEFGISCIPALYDILKNPNKSSEKKAEPSITIHKMEMSSSSGTVSEKSVVVISLVQPIVKYSSYPWIGTSDLVRLLKTYKKDDSIIGVVLNVDSGGGQAYGTPILYEYIKEFKESKPLVVYTDGFLCSAAYYLAAPASKIIANKRAEAIGSIGAFATIIDFDGIWEHFGAKVHTMYADESTEKNKDYREVLEGNYRPYIKNVLNPLVEQFWSDMISERPQINALAKNGDTYNGEKSLELGLVDELGTLDDAIQSVITLYHNNFNSNTNTMAKERLKIQGVLNLDAPLAVNENGSYLNEEQLDTVESALSDKDSEIATLKADLQKAQENTELKDQLTASQDSLTKVESSVDAMLTASGLPVEGTLTEKIAALDSKVVEMAGKPGANPTNPPISTDEGKGSFEIDLSAEHNKLANEIFKK